MLYEDSKSQADFESSVMPLIREKNGTIRAGINGDRIYFALSSINIQIYPGNETAYVFGVSRKESAILSEFNDFVLSILETAIIQAVIFLIFVLLTLIIA